MKKKFISVIIITFFILLLSNVIVSAAELWWFPLTSYKYIGCRYGCDSSSHPSFPHSAIHKGVDIPADSGTPIRVTQSGTIERATYSSLEGNYIVIRHSNNVYSAYKHMSSFAVTSGSVSQGQIIGYVGSTGNSSGPHLHFEMGIGTYYQNTFDPLNNPYAYVDPNNPTPNPTPPTITNFSTLYSEYSIGTNPSISMSATNIGHYDTWLYRNGELVETGSTTESTYIFTSTIQDGYTYSARVTAINNLGNTISDLIYFKLKSKPSILSVKSKKASYYVGENPSISMSATNNGHYDVWLYKNGALIETGSTTNNTYTFSSVIEEGNTYSFRITAINDYGSVISDLVVFSTKKYNTLSIQKNEYSPEETITFTWSSLATASHYDFYIYNEKGEIFTTGTTKNTQISYKLNKGNYSARVTPVYNGGIVISNLVYFSVRINDDLASRDFTIQKYNGYAAVINNDVTRTATVIVADYTNGVLTDISSQQVSFTQGQSKQFSYGNGAEHKIFVWDSLSGMKPLCKSE